MQIRNSRYFKSKVPLSSSDNDIVSHLAHLHRLHDMQSVQEYALKMTNQALTMGSGVMLYTIGILIALLLPVIIMGWLTGYLVVFVSLFVFLILSAGFVILGFKPRWFYRFVTSSFTLYQRQSKKNE